MNRTLLQRLYLWIPGTLALVWAIYESIRIRWIADDAFISFRYALNLIRGHGLVFNAGFSSRVIFILWGNRPIHGYIE